MKTEIFDIDENNIDFELIKKCSETLKKGGTVVFPTETVYGLGANALDKNAVEKIFAAKNRPSDNPLIIHIGKKSQANDIAREITENSKKLMEFFWPGPLTIIFKKKANIPDSVTCGLDTVAVRMPENKIALELLKESGIPVAAPSANISGKPSGTDVLHVIDDLKGKVDIIINGGLSKIGIESTVIDMTGNIPMILRPGIVTLEQISTVIGYTEYDSALDSDNKNAVPKSPGQKYRHYSPESQMILFRGAKNQIERAVNEKYRKLTNDGKKVIILCVDERKNVFEGITYSMGSEKNPISISSNLFRLLRKADEEKTDFILVDGIKETAEGKAIMNRLKKASGEIIYCGD